MNDTHVQLRFADKMRALNSLETEKEILAYQVSNLEELVDKNENYDRK
jgi:hypothetical protein